VNSPIPINSPLAPLAQDHVVALAKLAALDKAVADLAAKGTSPEALAVLDDFRAFLDGPLARHFKQEEEVLFPPLEAVMGRDRGPTAVMRHEHVELLAAMDAWRSLADRVAAAPARTVLPAALELQRVSRQIIAGLGRHIHKEDNVLFPMSHRLLPPATLEDVGKKLAET